MNRVLEFRIEKGITQSELAKAAKISRPFLFDIEKGNRGAKDETWQRIAKALGVSVEVLKGEVPDDTASGGNAELS